MASSSSCSSSSYSCALGSFSELSYQQSEQPPRSGWDIFLSHSGEQKGFAKDLFKRLSPPYSVFFDIKRPSLPLGEPFPCRIFDAAKTCKVALVVLSNEFLCSKWPMLELCTFFDAPGVQVLPLFYELSSKNLSDKDKVQEWRERWKELESQDDRIKALSCFNAFQKLRSINGCTFEKLNGHMAYLDDIKLAISQFIPRVISHSLDVVHGRDRLCKILIDKFTEMERNSQNQFADISRVLVLGVHGFSGSGKTTLCECLCDHYYSSFPDRALHLKLPTNPSPTQLLKTFEKLLKLTDWGRNREKMMMSEIEDFPTMVKVFKASNLHSLKMFLVIDNITSEFSIESVLGILRVGIGAGSRLMLVAQTREILYPLLKLSGNPGHHINHYAYDQMRVPSLNEEEAISMILQHACGQEMVEEYSASHREIIAEVASMCAFRNWPRPLCEDNFFLYLPLVLKIVGGQLGSNGIDLEELKRHFLRGKTTLVKDLKEEVVGNILSKSYQNLPENLKLLFLDVVFFMITYRRSSYIGKEEDLELLGFMQECSPERINRELKKLRRLGFLEGSDNKFFVHDLLLEYAKSVQSIASDRYYCRGRKCAREQVMQDLLRESAVGVQAVFLEVDEKCERFEFPAGLSSVKVVIVRACKSLAVLGLTGLTSLVSLEVVNCPSLEHVMLDPSHTRTLSRVRWAKIRNQKDIVTLSQQESSQMVRAGRGLPVKWLMSRLWCSISTLTVWHYRPPAMRFVNIASQLKALQILRLEKTGIRILGDLSSCWPQLRVLEVLESDLEILEVRNFPELKQFFYGVSSRKEFLRKDGFSWETYKRAIQRAKMRRNPDLLAGCPQLEDVRICGPSYEDGMGALRLPPKSRILFLKHIYKGDQPVRLEFTSSAHLLEEIVIDHHWILEGIEFSSQILNLVSITLCDCPNVITITGLECLPMLQRLKLQGCHKLQSLQNLEALSMLESVVLCLCPKLTITSLALSSPHLATIEAGHACPNVQFQASNLEKLTMLRSLKCKVSGSSFNLKNLVKLETAYLHWVCGDQAEYCNPLSLCSYDDEVNSEQVNSTSAVEVQGIQYMSLLVVSGSVVPPLSELSLQDVQNLASLDGLHCFNSIRELHLTDLPRLACLQGLQHLTNLKKLDICRLQILASLDGIDSSVEELRLSFLPKMTCLQRLASLTNLTSLRVYKCEAVKELLSLCTLVNLDALYIEDCVNLVRLESVHYMRSLRVACFDGCKNLEYLDWDAKTSLEQLSSDHILTSKDARLSFKGCYKLASIQAMLGWVLAEKVSITLIRASWNALIWEVIEHRQENTEKRKELAEQLVETLRVFLTKKAPALSQCDDCIDFQPWVNHLKVQWRSLKRCSLHIKFPRGLTELIRKVDRVPVKELVQQYQSDAHFRASVLNCLLETHPLCFEGLSLIRFFDFSFLYKFR